MANMENVPEIKEICKNCRKEYYRYIFVYTDRCETCGSIAFYDSNLKMEKHWKKYGRKPVPWESYAPWMDEKQKFKEWRAKEMLKLREDDNG